MFKFRDIVGYLSYDFLSLFVKVEALFYFGLLFLNTYYRPKLTSPSTISLKRFDTRTSLLGETPTLKIETRGISLSCVERFSSFLFYARKPL